MENKTMVAYYLTKTMKGFENYMGTRIYCVEQYTNENTLDIYARVNPTTDAYLSRSEFVEVEVKFNLLDGTYKIKVVGTGSRKYGQRVKTDMASIIDHLVKEAENTYHADSAEALWLTQKVFYNELKNAGAEVAELNEFHANSLHCENVNEVAGVFGDVMLKVMEYTAPKAETTATTEQNENVVYESLEFIIHPVTGHAVPDYNFELFNDWKEVEFIKATECMVIEVAGGFMLKGIVNGSYFETMLSIDEYFDGKHFVYDLKGAVEPSQPSNVIPFPVDRMKAPVDALESPEQVETVEPDKKVGTTLYYPEMGDKKPVCDIEVKLGYGGKWRLKTALELSGRGIKLHSSENGINIYYATDNAFYKLEKEFSMSHEVLLD